MSVSRKNKRPKNFFPERKFQTSTKTMTLEFQSALLMKNIIALQIPTQIGNLKKINKQVLQ